MKARYELEKNRYDYKSVEEVKVFFTGQILSTNGREVKEYHGKNLNIYKN